MSEGAGTAGPALTLELLPDGLAFVVANAGGRPLRVWDRETSWGWPTLELEVEPAGGGERLRLAPAPRRWTRNFPAAVEIAPGDSHRFAVARDERWSGVEALGELRGEPLSVRGRLRIPPSAEAAEHGVFVGEVASPAHESSPPHGWLPAG